MREVILAFRSPQAVADLTALSTSHPVMVYTQWVPAHGVNYCRTDEDDLHIVNRYNMTPWDVPLQLAVMCSIAHGRWMLDEGDNHVVRRRVQELRAEIERNWAAFVENHKVRYPVHHVPGAEQLCDQLMLSNATDIAFRRHTFRDRSGVRLGSQSTGGFGRHARLQREHGGMTTQGQQAAALRRREQQQTWQYDWDNAEAWRCPGPSHGEIVTWPIQSMEDKFLWDTINWIVKNVVHLFRMSGLPFTEVELLTAKKWLARQITFRALIKEAARRKLTFPVETFRYLKEYVLGRAAAETIEVIQPWRDPAASSQNEGLQSFLDEPTDPGELIDPIRDFGREFRDITLD